MELRHIKYFLAVAETQNIRLAAEKVHVTQPAISRKIKELESELGVELFDRISKGIKLNRVGKMYQKEVAGLLRQLDDANDKVKQYANIEHGSFALGVPDFILLASDVNQCVNQFRQENHRVSLEVFSDMPLILLKRLELDQIDGAFFYHLPHLSDEYISKDVSRDRLVLAYPNCWNREIHSSLSIQELNDLPMIRLPRSFDKLFYDWQSMLFSKIGWAPNSTQWAHGESTMLGLVAAGNGVAMVNERHFTRHSDMICSTPLDILPQTMTLKFVYKKESTNPILKAFLHQLDTVMGAS